MECEGVGFAIIAGGGGNVKVSVLFTPCHTPGHVCYVVDGVDEQRSPQLQPVGVWGELWLGGVQVARGYLRRPELTAERFVAHPWPAADPSGGRGVAYRTGDRVRWYADGELEFGGRIDLQVKLRGQRLELGEVEHALRAQPRVLEAVVLLRADGGTREPALVAYVSPASAVGGDESAPVEGAAPFTEARPFERVPSLGGARSALPAYMLPSVVVGVDAWPRTSSGKIDRKRLPAPSRALASDAAAVVAPRTAEEAAARDAFAAVLGVDAASVSVEASFFELGGNSLRAVALARRLSTALGREVGAADVLHRPTVAALAAAITPIAVFAGARPALVIPPTRVIPPPLITAPLKQQWGWCEPSMACTPGINTNLSAIDATNGMCSQRGMPGILVEMRRNEVR